MRIPELIINELEKVIQDLSFGTVSLEIKLHDKKPVFRIITEKSFIPGKLSSGAKVEKC